MVVKTQSRGRIVSLLLFLALAGTAPLDWSRATVVSAQVASIQSAAHNAEQTAISLSERLAPLVSDDFNSCTLDPRWAFINPLGDGALTMTGATLNLSVPAGTSHNVFDNGIPAPRIVQTVDDTDFEALVKFDSAVNQRFQVQGLLVIQDEEPDAEDFIRFDFFHDGTTVHLYAATIRNGVPLPQFDVLTTATSGEYYLKVRRQGMIWYASFSFDGVNFTERNFSLTTPLVVTQVGPFAANHGGTVIPAHTAVVDYFFNTASPINPEDARPSTLALAADPADGGAVVIESPAGVTDFVCGQPITLRAQPADGWRLAGWSGAVSGSTNPVDFLYTVGDSVTALFVQGEGGPLYLPLVSSN